MASNPPGKSLSGDTMAGIRVVFFEECDEHLAELESGLLTLQDGSRDPEVINTIFRAVHSIKGGASIFALDGLVDFAHHFETTLSQLRAKTLELDAPLIKTLLKAADVLADLTRAARDGKDLDDDRAAPLIDVLCGLSAATADEEEEDDGFSDIDFQPVALSFSDLSVAEPRTLGIRLKPFAELYAKANDPVLLLRELHRLGVVDATLDEAALPLLDSLSVDEGYLTWNIRLHTTYDDAAVREVFEFVEHDCDLSITPHVEEVEVAAVAQVCSEAAPAAAPAPVAPSIRVDLDRVDRMIDLVSELVINQSILIQRIAGERLSNPAAVTSVLEDLDKLTREIQDSVMAIRAQPVKAVFQRMSRLVREVEAQTGKAVHLITDGDATEVDRTVIERLSDPLTHMVRNAIDHGIESQQARLAAGKPAEGTLRIAAAHRGGRIIIEVSDDGAGINRQRVRQKAIERGVIAADAKLTDEELDNLIFAPGFSTAETVSDLSGRGVGMDVVKSGVQALSGRISVTSVEGKGSTFTLSLPLTLAVMDGMLVQVGDQSVVAPLTTLVESFQVSPGDITRLGPETTILTLRGMNVPLLDLGKVLGFGGGAAADHRRVALLVEDDAGQRAALLVDDILGQQQVVIKSLELNYREVPGVAAATILGDGRVALILDINAILTSRRRDCAAQAA